MTDWTQFKKYCCRHCGENCINRLDEPVTETKQCRSCFSIPDLDTAHHLEDRDDLPDDPLDVHQNTGQEPKPVHSVSHDSTDD